MPNTLTASISSPSSTSSASVDVPPPIELPIPEFASWQEAVDFARGMFARTRYLEAQVGTNDAPGPLVAAVSEAQIALAAADNELAQLLDAARNLLVQGKGLA